MHPASLLLAASSFIALIYYIVSIPKIKRNGIPLRTPPNTLPLVGNGIKFLQARHKLFHWFVMCERRFGLETFQIAVPSLPPGVVINDPKNLEYVLKNEATFAKGDFFKRRSWDLFGHGIINSDGELWKVQRKAGLQFLNNANLKVLTDFALPKYLDETVQGLRDRIQNSPVDLEEILHELTTQLMGRMAYNMDIRHSDPFSIAFTYASGETAARFQNPLWQVTEIFYGRKLRESISTVKKFGSLIVSKAMQARKAEKIYTDTDECIGASSGTLINALLDSIHDEGMVADAALNYLSAGRDTTGQALTWTFYLLMKNPAKMKVVQAEAIQILLRTLNQRSLDDVDFRKVDTAIFRPTVLPYVLAVFYESLRLYPPVPFELKQCEQETTLPDGTFLPKHSIVTWCTWAMNRSKGMWGKDADEFKPERWLDKNGCLVTKTAWEFPVFNAGPRMCMGKKMAEMVATQVIATLALRFDFDLVDQNDRISKNSLTLPMEGGLPCRVKPCF